MFRHQIFLHKQNCNFYFLVKNVEVSLKHIWIQITKELTFVIYNYKYKFIVTFLLT